MFPTQGGDIIARKRKSSLKRVKKNKNVVSDYETRQLEAVKQGISEQNQLLFKKSEEALKFYDPTIASSKSFTTGSKELLRQYISNPYSYASQLRSLSRDLRFKSGVYAKIINDNACMIDTKYRQIIPNIDFTKNNPSPDSKVKKSYFETAKMLDYMNLPSEMLKVYLECWTVDVFYGVYYYFKDQGGFLFPLDPDYCAITGVYPTGDFSFALDCSWLSNYDDELIEMWGEPFTTLKRNYDNDSMEYQWQEMPAEYACCMKINLENYEYAIPPLLPLFNSLLNLEDMKNAQALAEAAKIYKLLVYKMPLIKGSMNPDDFAVDPRTCMAYYDKAIQVAPDEYVGSIISPGMDIEAITFPEDGASDVDRVENSSKNIMKSAGHTAIAEPEGATAVIASLKADEDYAISSLLPQTEGWVNRMLQCHLSNPSKVKFLEVTKYTKEEYKESLIKDMNYGLPMITALGALNGFSEIELMALAEAHEMMDLRTMFYPYATAATQGAHNIASIEAGENGRPKGETVTDDSESSEEKRDSSG